MLLAPRCARACRRVGALAPRLEQALRRGLSPCGEDACEPCAPVRSCHRLALGDLLHRAAGGDAGQAALDEIVASRRHARPPPCAAASSRSSRRPRGFRRIRIHSPFIRSPWRMKWRWPSSSVLRGSLPGMRLPGAAIPQHHRAAAIFALGDRALEGGVASGWSSVRTASRLSSGLRLGPRVTAQLFSTPSSSSRKSQCSRVASCFCTMKTLPPARRRFVPPAPRSSRSRAWRCSVASGSAACPFTSAATRLRPGLLRAARFRRLRRRLLGRRGFLRRRLLRRRLRPPALFSARPACRASASAPPSGR